MSESLAVKYRPKKFVNVVEQSSTTAILQSQLSSGDIKNAYLFCGGAGTGKTTCARIFASEINDHKGVPIELDAASNNSVDDVREIIAQSKTASLDSEYKVFILDEVHALSNNAWQAMLKVLEEPPKKSIFIMCTTDPQKIPKTILSRVQRFDFQRISQDGIMRRLCTVLSNEYPSKLGPNDIALRVDREALIYIAKQAQGGMRDALTLLDKCLSYSTDLTMENVISALGVAKYDLLMDFVNAYIAKDISKGIQIINKFHMDGYDLKLVMRQLTDFVLDIYKYHMGVEFQYLMCPETDEIKAFMMNQTWTYDEPMLESLITLNNEIKWNTSPKARIEAWFITRR